MTTMSKSIIPTRQWHQSKL